MLGSPELLAVTNPAISQYVNAQARFFFAGAVAAGFGLALASLSAHADLIIAGSGTSTDYNSVGRFSRLQPDRFHVDDSADEHFDYP
jgi:hypothetical protein